MIGLQDILQIWQTGGSRIIHCAFPMTLSDPQLRF